MTIEMATRERFIEAALKHFAERGFYGASIASIVQELPFTKQALLHHFGSKEKLYGEVLKQISEHYVAALELEAEKAEVSASPGEIFIGLYRYARSHPDETQLLMRELLDNRRRAASSKKWYLKTFLDQLVNLFLRGARDSCLPAHVALSRVYQVLGAINYYAVSGPTLQRIFGEDGFEAIDGEYEESLRELVTAQLKRPAR